MPSRHAVQQVLTEGYRTVDIMADGCKQVGTVEMGRLICERIKQKDCKNSMNAIKSKINVRTAPVTRGGGRRKR